MDDFARAALVLHVTEHGYLCRVVIELVMRSELVVPFELSRVGVERDERIAI